MPLPPAQPRLDPALLLALDQRYAMNASAKALRRGLKSKLVGDLLSHG